MGNKNSGARRTPTAIKLLRGVTRRDRLNPNEPHPPIASEEFDTPPMELDGDAIAADEWRRIVPMLRRISLVTVAERSVLIAVCQQWSRYITAFQHVTADGMLVETERGPIVSPYVSIADKALAQCRSMWGELGLTPGSRSKLQALPSAITDQPVSKWAGLLS